MRQQREAPSPTMEKQEEKQQQQEQQQQQHKKKEEEPPHISSMKPINIDAYGGGLYGKDVRHPEENMPKQLPASETQSADGPDGPTVEPKHKPPPSSGDRDVDITGQSYIQ